MTDPASRRTNKKAFPLDVVLILLLVAALIGGTILAGRRGGKKTADAQSRAATDLLVPTLPERQVKPEQIGYREGAPINIGERVYGLAVGSDDTLFVSAGFTIRQYDPEGREQHRFELDTTARALAVVGRRLFLGCGDHIEVLDRDTGKKTLWEKIGDDAFITSVAASNDTLFVGDAGDHLFLRYDLDGTLLGKIGMTSAGTAVSVKVPSTYFDVSAADDGTFWAVEAGHFGVVHYDAEGKKLGRFGRGSNAIEDFGGCCNPTHVAVGPGGIIVTVEKKPDVVKTYHLDGTFRNVVAGPKAFARKTFIADVACDSKGRVLVLDPKAKAVRIFLSKDKAKP